MASLGSCSDQAGTVPIELNNTRFVDPGAQQTQTDERDRGRQTYGGDEPYVPTRQPDDSPTSDEPAVRDADPNEVDACTGGSLDLAMQLSLTPPPPTAQWTIKGDAVVLGYTQVPDSAFTQQLQLEFVDGGTVTMLVHLPDDKTLPLTHGEAVHVYAGVAGQDWIANYLAVWSASDQLRIFVYSGPTPTSITFNCEGQMPCPAVSQTSLLCPPVDLVCGTAVHAQALVWTGLSALGNVPVAAGQQTAAGGFDFCVGESMAYKEVTCPNAPPSWVELAVLNAAVQGQPAPFQPEPGVCDLDKIGFDQDNKPDYDFYEVCVPDDGMKGAHEGQLKAIDGTLTCSVSGTFAGCTGAEQGCRGLFNYKHEHQPTLTDQKWSQLCSVSQAKFVTKVAGGKYSQ